jgi:signal transduction histidine kinase
MMHDMTPPDEASAADATTVGAVLAPAAPADAPSRNAVDEFVSTVSHELRAPLTAITAALTLLDAGGAGPLPEMAVRLVAIARDNSQRLARLVNDILDVEKVEAGEAVFDMGKVDVRATVARTIDNSRAVSDAAGVRLRFDSRSGGAHVRADPDRLVQVITNLLSIAIKFSPRGEEVVIAVNRRDDVVRVTVRDHGPGIPDDFKRRVFEKFAQARTNDAPVGSGLGLNITRRIVQRLGGAIGFESARGRGTLFWVELPSWREDERVEGLHSEAHPLP